MMSLISYFKKRYSDNYLLNQEARQEHGQTGEGGGLLRNGLQKRPRPDDDDDVEDLDDQEEKKVKKGID